MDRSEATFETRRGVAALTGLTWEARDSADRMLTCMLHDHDFPKPSRVFATKTGGVRAVWEIEFPAYRSELTLAVTPDGRCQWRKARTPEEQR
jgi:hypothetical protein